MEIKTEGGIAKPMPLSDIQQNNRLLNMLLGVFVIWTTIFLWLIWYVIKNNVVNNYIAHCVC